MNLSDKQILIISPEPWYHLRVSKHLYALHLANRGNRVYFLNPPASQNKISPSGYENLDILDYSGFVNGLRFFPKLLRKLVFKRVWRKLEQMARVRFDVIWSFDNSVFYDFDAFPKSVLKISHIVDLNQDFMSGQAAGSADVCIFNSSHIGDKLKTHNAKSFFINHGYSKAVNLTICEIPKTKKVKVGYAGNLDIRYLDWPLIDQVVGENPGWNFYFAGGCTNQDRLNWFHESQNVIYLGKLQSNQLQSFYSQMDVLIIAYLADNYREQLANPHKMMEYLASGKPIVATYTAEYADLDFIGMSKQNKDWSTLLKQTIDNLDQENTDEKIATRKAFALDNTYDKQIDRIEQIISKVCK